MKIDFDHEKFEQLAQYFHDACNINLFFHVDTGEVCYEPKVKCEICELLRQIPQLSNACHKCTVAAQQQCYSTKKLQIYQCHVGFTEVMLPIFINNICAGYLVFGQIINTDSTMTTTIIQNTLNKYFQFYHFQIENLSEKIDRSVKMSMQSIRAIAEIMSICASHSIISDILKLESMTVPLLMEEYIDRNLQNSLRSEDICREFNISRSQLYLIAQKNFKCGISKYIQNKRIERAKELLVSSNAEISHIAEMVGIIDNAYFSRYFKISTGLSPKEYRQRFSQKSY